MEAYRENGFRGDDQPTTLFVDRGPGFYNTNGGKITPAFAQALEDNNLKAYYPTVSSQPGNLQDFLLHETAVAWIRHREKKTKPKVPWEETPAEVGQRLRAICQDINDNLEVDDLCRRFPKRLQALVDAKGERLST